MNAEQALKVSPWLMLFFGSEATDGYWDPALQKNRDQKTVHWVVDCEHPLITRDEVLDVRDSLEALRMERTPSIWPEVPSYSPSERPKASS